jgi:hypothetical protein
MSNHREFANQSVTKASLGLDQQVEESDKAASSPFPADASAGASFRLGDAEVFRKIDSQSGGCTRAAQVHTTRHRKRALVAAIACVHCLCTRARAKIPPRGANRRRNTRRTAAPSKPFLTHARTKDESPRSAPCRHFHSLSSTHASSVVNRSCLRDGRRRRLRCAAELALHSGRRPLSGGEFTMLLLPAADYTVCFDTRARSFHSILYLGLCRLESLSVADQQTPPLHRSSVLQAPSMGKSVDPFTSGGGPFLSSSMHGFGDEGFNGDNDSFGFGGYRDASEPHPHPHPHTHPHTHAHTTKGKGKDKQMLSTAPTPLMATPAASTTTTTPTPTPTPSSNLTAQIAASAAASAAAGVDVMPPCVPGGYLEPHCHFFTRASPRTVEGAVTSFLNDCESQVDFERRPIKYKLKCVSYSRGGARMNFNVRIFTADKTAGDDNDGAGDGHGDGNGGATPRLVVEFQRRSGCPCHFQAIYGAAIAKLRADGIIADDAASSSTSDDGDSLGMSALSLESPSPRSSSSLEPPSFADLMAASGDTFDTVGDDASSSLSSSASVLDDFAAPCADTLRSLLHMAESPHMDVKSEALHALAEISAPARTRDGSDGGAIDECSALVASQIANDDALLSLLCKSLADEYEDVHRCAATSLANVTEARCTVACQRLTTLNIVPLLRSLTVATSTRQVVREALRALCNLVAVLDVDVLDDDLRASLDAMCDDRSIRSYYDTLLGHTAAATTAVPSQ